MKNDYIRKQYNKVAEEYLKNRHIFKNDKYLDTLSSLLPKEATILDIGCGGGVPIDSYLIKKGFKVTGIDISEKQIELARKHVPEGTFIQKDMSELHEDEYRVDAIVSFYAIFHTPRETHLNLLKKMKTFLSIGGYMLITMGYSDWEGKETNFFGGEMEWSQYGAEKNKELILQAGFKILSSDISISGREKHLVVLAQK